MADQELKWWHVRWRFAGRAIFRVGIVCGKILVPLCLLAAVGYGVLYLLSPWGTSHRLSHFDSRVGMVPVELPTKAEAPLSDETIHCYGFSIRLPKKEVTRTLPGDLTTMILFRDGGMTMRNPSRYSSILEPVTGNADAAKLIGLEAHSSKYKLMQAAMWATPEQAKWWRFRMMTNEKVEYLLLAKFVFLTAGASPNALGPIYAISSGGFHGFQIGNPDAPPYDAHVDVFDEANRYFTFDITVPRRHSQLLTQAEINAIVASIKPD